MSPKLTRRINLGRRYLGHSPHVPPTHTHTHTHTHTQPGKGQNPQNIQLAQHDTNPDPDPVKTPAEGDNPDTKPRAILEKKPPKWSNSLHR